MITLGRIVFSLSALAAAFCFFQVFIDRGGAISPKEAMPFLLLSGAIATVSGIWTSAAASKQKRLAAQQAWAAQQAYHAHYGAHGGYPQAGWGHGQAGPPGGAQQGHAPPGGAPGWGPQQRG